jgi:hypothetical protein
MIQKHTLQQQDITLSDKNNITRNSEQNVKKSQVRIPYVSNDRLQILCFNEIYG